MVVVARSVPAGAAAEAVARRGFGGVARKADAGAGGGIHDGGSAAGTGGGCCCARRCWMAPRSMRVMARSSMGQCAVATHPAANASLCLTVSVTEQADKFPYAR